MSSVTVAKPSVILAFKFVIYGTGVENTLSLTYRHKKKLRWVISGDRGGQGVGPSLSQSTCLVMLHPKTDQLVNPSVELRHLLAELSATETLLTEVQRKVLTCPGKHSLVIGERLYAHPVHTYIHIRALYISTNRI